MGLLNLLPCPPELKPIAPYLQRSDELSTKDPVMAYWCAYYAAQAGIARKPKDTASRSLLMSLLNTLEQMKKDASPNDAIDDESVSSAYIENFALRVFALADNEDRRGEATRGTAKKFLAAANFLELLRIFDKDKPDLSTDNPNEEKIRYAKWKAADIAKAFREGRKPTPGPADGSPSLSPGLEPATTASSESSTIPPPTLLRDTQPPPHLADLPSPQNEVFFEQGVSSLDAGTHLFPGGAPHTPGSWSTAATPGTPGRFAVDEDSPPSSGTHPSYTRKAFVGEELEGREEEDETTPPGSATYFADDEYGAKKAVRFSPSVDGVPEEPSSPSVPDVVISNADVPPSAAPETGLPAGFVPDFIGPEPSAPPLPDLPAGFVPISPPTPYPPHSPSAPLPPSPIPPPAPAHAPYVSQQVRSPPALEPATITPAPELTPVMITRVQKHCRFAISSLDYEDAEQARKELRAALQILGG
ncbi:Vta1 like-domain-containing protein [Amylocystis lapponica]|nr:Vta1 like-domain-containing protein [Amylocystis lapponica]